MARDVNGKIDNKPEFVLMNNLQLLDFAKNDIFQLQNRFDALLELTERMYKQVHLLDKNSRRET